MKSYIAILENLTLFVYSGLLCAFIGFCFGCWSERRRRNLENSSLTFERSQSGTGSSTTGARHHQVIHFGDPVGCHQMSAYYDRSVTTRSAKSNSNLMPDLHRSMLHDPDSPTAVLQSDRV